MNIVTKTHVYYTQHGLWRTLARITERLTRLQLLSLARAPRLDGRATVILNAGQSRMERRLAHVTPGTAVGQELGLVFDEIFEIELRLEVSERFERGAILLVGPGGKHCHYEPIDRTRVRDGVYTILFDKALQVAGAGRLCLVIWNAGDHGNVRLGLATDFDGQLSVAVRRRVADSSAARLVGESAGSARLRAPLSLRVSGRSSSEHAAYHRAPVPNAWRRHTLDIGVVYTEGLGLRAVSQEARRLRLKKATPDAIRFDEGRPDATSVLLLGPRIDTRVARELIAAARRRFIPVVAVLGGQEPPPEMGSPFIATRQLAHWSDLVLVQREADAPQPGGTTRAARISTGGVVDWLATVRDWLPLHRRQILPRLSIVTILYNKAAALPAVLRSFFLQSYEGEFDLVFVDDASPDDSAAVVERIFADARSSGAYARLPSYKVIRNEKNLGNCVSRNVGLAHAGGDVAVIIDADCMVNRDFLRRHAQAHSFGDTDVVIGPLNIETRGEEPLGCLESLEAQPAQAARRTELQDEFNRTSFVNCITRNFSIGMDAIEPELFDPAFSYRADPSSGFGWEDVEMGYRLYRRGLRIKYVSDAFSIHITHDPPLPDRLKPARSVRNFRRLLEKHPDLRHEARRWVRHTARALQAWFEVLGIEPNEDLNAVRAMAPAPEEPAAAPLRRMPRRPGELKILSYRWHVPHQYELYKLGYDFALVRDLGTSSTQSWELGLRPLPDNARFISRTSIRESELDLAIVHFDENVLSWENCNGVIGAEWGAAFRWFMENVKLPKVAVCHGTPQFHGQFRFAYDKPDLLQVIEPARRRLVECLGDTLVICNSHQAQREWGFRRSRVIWHGFDPAEYPPTTYERGILSPPEAPMLSRPHYRGYFVHKEVLADFPAAFSPATLSVPDPCPLYHGNQFACWKYRNYVDEIRRYSVFFNPTQRSPMPRTRGETMMCGLAIVTANNHDVDMFIRNGVNGFHSNEPLELREQLRFLAQNPAAARRMGAEGRRTAIQAFNIDRFLADWRGVIRATLS